MLSTEFAFNDDCNVDSGLSNFREQRYMQAMRQTSRNEQQQCHSCQDVENTRMYCLTCDRSVCNDCVSNEHRDHEYSAIVDVYRKRLEKLTQLRNQCQMGVESLPPSHEYQVYSDRLNGQYTRAQKSLRDALEYYHRCVYQRYEEIVRQLESVYTAQQNSLRQSREQNARVLSKLQNTSSKLTSLLEQGTQTQVIQYTPQQAQELEALLRQMKATNRNNSSAAQQNSLGSQLDATFGEFYFCFDQKQIQSGVLNSFGHLQKPGGLQGDLAVGGSVSSSTGPTSSEGSSGNASPNHLEQHARAQALSNGHSNGNCNNTNSFFERTNSITHEQSSRSVSASTLLSSEFDFFSSGCSSNDDGIDHWYGPSSASATSGYNSSFNSSFSIGMNGNSTPMRTSTGSNADLNSSMSLFMDASPPHRSQSGTVVPRSPSRIQAPKRQKMSYVTKFGEFGPQAGQFSEPSGVAVTKDKEILVADTNNHRIQIFCAKGTYKYAWGDCGKRDGQMLYPNRVAIAPSGEVIITERAPTHQVQVYSPYGKFIRKFGADVLQHPRGVCVDPSGRIIVVECRVMRVFVFESDGQVYSRFSCSQHLEFPNGVVANNEEIFISDNRAHCVKVFSYHGQFMRQIGGEGLTNFPIGVCLTPRGHILIADNHNNFNVTIFRTDGSLVAAYESKVKHSQCFDVSLLDEGSVVLASKDYRIYVYRYAGGSASSGVNGVSASNGGSVSPDSSCAQTPIGQVATSNGSYCLGGSSSNGFGSPPSPSNLKMTSSVGNLANLYAGMSVDTPTALSGSISPPANCSSTLSPPSSALQHQVSSAAVSIQSLMIDTPLKCAYSNSDHHFSQDAAELLLNGARD